MSDPQGDRSPELRDDRGGLSCTQALTRIYEFLDGGLSHVSHAAVAEHFRVCVRCYPHLALEQSFRDAVRRALSSQGAPPSLRLAVLRALDEERR
jgi:anti-sigma factor (TIGR02949 family)